MKLISSLSSNLRICGVGLSCKVSKEYMKFWCVWFSRRHTNGMRLSSSLGILSLWIGARIKVVLVVVSFTVHSVNRNHSKRIMHSEFRSIWNSFIGQQVSSTKVQIDYAVHCLLFRQDVSAGEMRLFCQDVTCRCLSDIYMYSNTGC